MNGTPRLRSAFPTTPQTTGGNRAAQNGVRSPGAKTGAPLPSISSLTPSKDPSAPVIPVETIDAATQRLYAAAIYAALWAWRWYDFWHLMQDDTESLWQFMKWVAIDASFLYGLPQFRIPWLEWSPTVITVLFMAHAVVDGMLMFRIGLPIRLWLVAFTKLFYDKELAISERRVKPADITHNASLILGRQVIHILPEGSAMLNPHQEHFCIGASTPQVQIPIQINQTTPIQIELLRIDFDTGENETTVISASAAKKMRKEAMKHLASHHEGPLMLRHPVKKTGLYLLRKMIDESKLEVQTRLSEAVVVTCPRANLEHTGQNRCKGDLSNVALMVEGTPPLKIKYRKMVNDNEREASFQSIQPEDFVSPFPRQQASNALIRAGEIDVSWARWQSIKVPINETLTDSGRWIYSVDEVQDAIGNTVSYTTYPSDSGKPVPKAADLQQGFVVHERPRVFLQGCDTQRPIQVAKGQSIPLPIRLGSTGKGEISNSAHNIEFLFTPEEELSPGGEHGAGAKTHRVVLKNPQQKPVVQPSGLYTLTSISTEYCSGEIREPASCLLQNPPEPELTIATEEIFDKCAGNPIGLQVSLDLIGTPPFDVQYTVQKRGARDHRVQFTKLYSLRGQLELTPLEAGHYIYTFTEVSDAVYKGHSLKHKNLVLEQDVKPAASAHFVELMPKRKACLGEPVAFDVRLQGESPWTLEYELVHGSKRSKHTVKDVESEHYTIKTEKLLNGGDYSLALVSIVDRLGCKEFLKEEAKINVRHQRPKASFGEIEGRRSVRTLEGKKLELPLKFSGEGPWTLTYHNLDDTTGALRSKTVQRPNDWLEISDRGTYELVELHDAVCPGSVDPLADHFEVGWIPRPSMQIQESSIAEHVGSKHIKTDVCEGADDSFEITFSGTPPFDVKYEEHYKPDHGSKSLRNKELNVALGIATIQMETTQAGEYEYRFTGLEDANYDHDPKRHAPLTVQQRVNPRPIARFAHPGKTYSYCTTESDGEEVIPIAFTGIPPFHVELELRHHGTTKPETITIPNIPSHTYDLRIPHRNLHLGHSNLSVRKVRDSRGCHRKLDPSTSPRVQISVHDAPSIAPLESQAHYCVGDRLSFVLSGTAPFAVFYTFEGAARKATSPSTTFRRLAEKPGVFTITGVTDAASGCRAAVHLEKEIHPLPSVKVSKGRESVVDIHEGGEAEILFEFGGTPPFEFTYTRSENVARGRRGKVLETRTEVSYEHVMRVKASEEGAYEVVAVRDKWCAVSRQGGEAGGKAQKLLAY